VSDDKLEMLMAELRAIELWDRLPEGAVLVNEIDRAGGLEARRTRRLEIISEIGVLLNKADRDSDQAPHGTTVSMNGRPPAFQNTESS
jgi:hypothetical protein